MKKLLFLFLLIIIIPDNSFPKSIICYVCAALSAPTKKIVELYNKENNKNKGVVITGGTGELVNKIFFAKRGDIFIAPSRYYKNLLKKKNMILYSEDLLFQSPVIALSKTGEKKIKNFKGLTSENIKIALGNPKTMALGKIFLKIKQDMPDLINMIEKNKAVQAINILQIVNYLKMNIVDAGILFDSLAKINNFHYINFPNYFKYKVTSNINILKTTNNFNLSKELTVFIIKNKNIFEKFGYKICK